MSDRHHEEKKSKLSHRIAQVIQRYRIVFIILGAAVILFPIGYYVVDAIRQSNNAAAALQNEKLNKKWKDYNSEQDDAKKKALEKELFDLIDESAEHYPDKYAGIQALFMRTEINKEKMEEADKDKKKELFISNIKDFMRVAEKAERNILAPQAVMKAAISIQNVESILSEETSVKVEEIIPLIPKKIMDTETAAPSTIQDITLIMYRTIVARYPESLYVPEALINIGFILETQQKPQEASEIYSRLESDFASSNWTKIAVNRKLDMETKGMISN